MDLSVTTQTADGVATIRVYGEVDLVSGPRVAREIKQATADDSVSEVVVNLAGTRFLDSTGIAVLLAGRREADEHGVEYRVEAAQGIVLEVLTLTGVWPALSGSPADSADSAGAVGAEGPDGPEGPGAAPPVADEDTR